MQQATTRFPLSICSATQKPSLCCAKMVPVAQRVLGESDEITLKMRAMYAGALCNADGATLDDIREAVTTLEDTHGLRGACSVARTHSVGD